jgi:hypothetical protein
MDNTRGVYALLRTGCLRTKRLLVATHRVPMTACAFWSSKTDREMAASTLLSNPNRHRACIKTAHPECEYKPGGEQRNQEQQQKQKPYEGKSKEQALTPETCSYKTRFSTCEKAVTRSLLPDTNRMPGCLSDQGLCILHAQALIAFDLRRPVSILHSVQVFALLTGISNSSSVDRSCYGFEALDRPDRLEIPLFGNRGTA